MPYQSDQQRKWAHTKAGTKALGGKKKVAHWDKASKGLTYRKKKLRFAARCNGLSMQPGMIEFMTMKPEQKTAYKPAPSDKRSPRYHRYTHDIKDEDINRGWANAGKAAITGAGVGALVKGKMRMRHRAGLGALAGLGAVGAIRAATKRDQFGERTYSGKLAESAPATIGGVVAGGLIARRVAKRLGFAARRRAIELARGDFIMRGVKKGLVTMPAAATAAAKKNLGGFKRTLPASPMIGATPTKEGMQLTRNHMAGQLRAQREQLRPMYDPHKAEAWATKRASEGILPSAPAAKAPVPTAGVLPTAATAPKEGTWHGSQLDPKNLPRPTSSVEKGGMGGGGWRSWGKGKIAGTAGLGVMAAAGAGVLSSDSPAAQEKNRRYAYAARPGRIIEFKWGDRAARADLKNYHEGPNFIRDMMTPEASIRAELYNRTEKANRIRYKRKHGSDLVGGVPAPKDLFAPRGAQAKRIAEATKRNRPNRISDQTRKHIGRVARAAAWPALGVGTGLVIRAVRGKKKEEKVKLNRKFIHGALEKEALLEFGRIIRARIPKSSMKEKLIHGAALAGGITAADVLTEGTMAEKGKKKKAMKKGLVKGALYGTALAATEPFLAKGLTRVLQRAAKR